MELQKPGPYHEPPPPHELAGIRRGHFCRLKMDSTYIWAMVTDFRPGQIIGMVESSFPGGPRRGDKISFSKKHVFEIN